MKKLLMAFVFVAVGFLAACEWEEPTIIYEGKERPESEVEEILEDKLEIENPEKDFEVEIAEEVED